MGLNQFAAERRLEILEDLKAGLEPRAGTFDHELLKEARTKGLPQMGSTRYEPHRITLEFIYSDPRSNTIVLPVQIDPPERIVFMPVPEWVVESIWQGEIDGTYHFESDAFRLLETFRQQLAPENNPKHFEARMATGRA